MSDNNIGFGGDAINPKWDDVGKVHDWRNYVSDKVRAMWSTFSDEQRIAIAEMAQKQADSEEWE